MLHGWAMSSSGLQKVMHLAVFLNLLRVEKVGTVRVSTWERATRFGTLNSSIPSLSDVTYERRILGEVASSNT